MSDHRARDAASVAEEVAEDDPGTTLGTHAQAWLFVRPDAVPAQWRDRAVSMSLVPLLPSEASALLQGRAIAPDVDPVVEAVAGLVARGLTVRAIARQLDISSRSVDRYLARLRERFDVGSTAELTAELARRGF